MSMKDITTLNIATLTFQRAINYGAVLQAYALQQAIGSLGVNTELLDYRCEAEENRYYRIPRNPKEFIGRIIRWPTRHKKMEHFAQFRKEHLSMSEPLDKNTIAKHSKNYSKIIVGSDQVWNLKLTDGDTVYFLDFVDDPSKKVSYAASIGSEKWPSEDEDLVRNLLSDYSFISVREKTTSEYLTELLGRKTYSVCDPVLLLSAEKWRFLSVAPDVSRPYVLVYTLGPITSDCMKWARTLADEKNLDLIAIHGNRTSYPNIINVRDAGPCEFLGYLANASYIVTNSFHGTCFSIIFNKQFAWFQSSTEDQYIQKRSVRITDLLDALDLAHRHVDGNSGIPSDIDYHVVNKSLEEFRQTSLQQLENIIRPIGTEVDK